MFTLNTQTKSSKINFSKTMNMDDKSLESKNSNFYEDINAQTFKNKKIKKALYMLSQV